MAINVYRERAHLVAHLAATYRSWLGVDPAEPDWPVVYVSLPTGQVSWHIGRDDLDLFEGLAYGGEPWDGHSTQQKYERLDRDTAAIRASRGR